jgi:hypothetical protein
MKYPSTNASPQPTIAVPKCMQVNPLHKPAKKPQRGTYTPIKPIATPIKKTSQRPVVGHIWERNSMGEWVLKPDPEESKAAITFELAALSWLENGGLAAIDAWMKDLQCVEPSCENLDCVNPEPQCPVAMPLEVQERFKEWMAKPVDEAAMHCRSGKDGPPALMVALKLVGAARRDEFAAADAAREHARVKQMAEEKAKDTTNGEAWVGPNGETAATHIRVVEHQKCGGKGQTVPGFTFVPIEKVASDDDEPKCKRGEIRWPLDPNQPTFGNLPINMM